MSRISLASTFMIPDLIDEYWVNINCIVLIKRIPLLKDVNNIYKLKLLDSKTYRKGVVKLHYARAI